MQTGGDETKAAGASGGAKAAVEGNRPDPVIGILVEALKAINKDTLGQFGASRTTQGAPVQGALMAYGSLAKAAHALGERIAMVVAEHKIKTLLLHPGEDIAELAEFRTFLNRLDAIDKRLADELEQLKKSAPEERAEAEAAALAMFLGRTTGTLNLLDAGVVLGSLAGPLVSAAMHLFGLVTRTATTETHGNVAIPDADLVAAFARNYSQVGVTVLRPAQVAIGATIGAEAPGRLGARLRSLDDKAQDLREALGMIESRLTPPGNAGAAGPAEPKAGALPGAKLRIEAALKSFDGFWGLLPQAIPRLMRGDAIHAALREAGAILALRVVLAGGSTRTEAKIGQDLVEHAGAVLIGYTLFAANGDVIAAGLVERSEQSDGTRGTPTNWSGFGA